MARMFRWRRNKSLLLLFFRKEDLALSILRSIAMPLFTRARLLCAAASMLCGIAHAQSAIEILKAGCADDARKLCSGVQPGGGRIIACLKQNRDQLSDQCKQAAAQAARLSKAGTPATASAAPIPSPAGTSDAFVAAPATTPLNATEPESQPARKGKAPSAGSAASYIVMKKVQITGPGPDAAHPTMPAFDLLIPSTWKIQGGVSLGGSPSGCFSDLFAIHLKATSADGSSIFAAGPDYSWQYADDPSMLKNLTDPGRRMLGAGGKPCPVARPMRAEQYIRQNILKLYPPGTTVVSVAPFPELDEIVRKRRGLPPGNGNTGSTRTDAIRMRLAYQKDGTDMESWVAVCVVVDISPSGRGAFYDSHATSLVSFSAPKAKLDANDRLFQVIVSSIHPEPQWVGYSGSMVAKLNQARTQQMATINAAMSQFYAHEAQVINGVTQNAMRGSDNSVFHADQNIRGVQTFRDPATGTTQEFSNLYDHAWQNGTGDYVMSNDPSFNPNEHMSGDWSQLQAVSP